MPNPTGLVAEYERFKFLNNVYKSAKALLNGESVTEENVNDIQSLLAEPYNETDPYVIFDPELAKPQATENHVEENVDQGQPVEKTKWDGIKYPIIKLNGMVIPPNHIESMHLKFRKFLPTLELVLRDTQSIDAIGIPSFLNQIVLIMVPQFQGLYRNIAMPFYIDERINEPGGIVKYKCSVHYKGLSDTFCGELSSSPLSTFEMLSSIAKKSGLGFAATDNCQNISDSRHRQVYSQKMSDYIEDQINISGLDDNSVFDAWVDGHGYIVLANLSWIFSSKILPENLMILEKTGTDIPVNNTLEGDAFECARTVCNIPGFNIPNLFFTGMSPYLNTEDAKDIGTVGSFWCLTDVGVTNTLVQQDIQMIDEAPDAMAHPEFYEFPKTEYIGADMSEGTPYLMQERVRKSWITKKRSKRLVIELKEINFGLERGMLINLITIDANRSRIGMIKQNEKNFVENNDTEGEPHKTDDTVETVPIATAATDNVFISNPGYSGMYYIDGIEYFYSIQDQKFKQDLILIRKGLNGTLFNLMAGETLTSEQDQIISQPEDNNDNSDTVDNSANVS